MQAGAEAAEQQEDECQASVQAPQQEEKQEQEREQQQEEALGDLAAAALSITPVLATVAGYGVSALDVSGGLSSSVLVRSHADAMSRLGFLCSATVSAMRLGRDLWQPSGLSANENAYFR